MTVWERISAIDRRWVFALIGAAVLFPAIVHISFPVGVTKEARGLYAAVDALPDSSIVMLTFDLYPNALAETEPMAVAALHHLFRKHCKVVTVTTIPFGGPSNAERISRRLATEYGKVYGEDFVNLGYKANYVSVLSGMGNAIVNIYPTDNSGTPLAQLPLMQHVRNYNDISFIFIVADNGIVDYWISIVNAQYHVSMGAAVTAVMAPKLYTYVESGQLVGLLGGMKGAAEYEQLVGKKGLAFDGMAMQSLVHLVIIALVALGNLSYFVLRRQGKRQ